MFVKEGVLDVCIPPQRKFVSRCLILFTDTLVQICAFLLAQTPEAHTNKQLCTVKKGSMIKFQCLFKLASLDAKEVSGTPIGTNGNAFSPLLLNSPHRQSVRVRFCTVRPILEWRNIRNSHLSTSFIC